MTDHPAKPELSHGEILKNLREKHSLTVERTQSLVRDQKNYIKASAHSSGMKERPFLKFQRTWVFHPMKSFGFCLR